MKTTNYWRNHTLRDWVKRKLCLCAAFSCWCWRSQQMTLCPKHAISRSRVWGSLDDARPVPPGTSASGFQIFHEPLVVAGKPVGCPGGLREQLVAAGLFSRESKWLSSVGVFRTMAGLYELAERHRAVPTRWHWEYLQDRWFKLQTVEFPVPSRGRHSTAKQLVCECRVVVDKFEGAPVTSEGTDGKKK